MKTLFFFSVFLFFTLTSCKQNVTTEQIISLEQKIDSLQKILDQTYKPGFGSMMNKLQMYHSKLWFSGINRNWKLAAFEINELKEVMENIEKYAGDRDEARYMYMLKPVVERVEQSIEEKDELRFRKSFNHLTKTCNKCHVITHFEYNKVKIPEKPCFDNQDFSVSR